VWGFFSYEDIFVAGIGFDIAGAYLLARGLLFVGAHEISPDAITKFRQVGDG
jgi:hypothetical protein